MRKMLQEHVKPPPTQFLTKGQSEEDQKSLIKKEQFRYQLWNKYKEYYTFFT